jgi:signal transduction histidine kinase
VQVQHAQKLDSLGVLAGGIAHDFNNLLTAVLGNADLASCELPAGHPAREPLAEAAQAAQRAAELTHQMPAYSGKGHFVVESVDLFALIREMSGFLKLASSKKCELGFSLARDLPEVRCDASQIHQVIMNLVINASEALGNGAGTITVTTGVTHRDGPGAGDRGLAPGLEAGEYVYLEVHDDGCGMSEDIRTRIFDPFFTTKFTGRGLGLSAVLGIVRGHRGEITCDARARCVDPCAHHARGRGRSRSDVGQTSGAARRFRCCHRMCCRLSVGEPMFTGALPETKAPRMAVERARATLSCTPNSGSRRQSS